jgi:hypothetical protein
VAATDLYDLCDEYLTACVAAVATAPGGEIDRFFVSPGPPAWDCCPQLTVHAGGPAEGDTAPLNPPLQPGHRAEVGIVNLVAMTATVIRCVPTFDEQTGRFPDAASIDAAAQATLGDCWAIWNHLLTLKRAGGIFAGLDGDAREREMFLDPAVALNTSGGCAGWQLQIRVQLWGYQA